jgi:hypothetical protein
LFRPGTGSGKTVRGTKVTLWKERVPFGVSTGKKGRNFGRARSQGICNLCSGERVGSDGVDVLWKRNDVAKGPRPPKGSMVKGRRMDIRADDNS